VFIETFITDNELLDCGQVGPNKKSESAPMFTVGFAIYSPESLPVSDATMEKRPNQDPGSSYPLNNHLNTLISEFYGSAFGTSIIIKDSSVRSDHNGGNRFPQINGKVLSRRKPGNHSQESHAVDIDTCFDYPYQHPGRPGAAEPFKPRQGRKTATVRKYLWVPPITCPDNFL